MASDSRSSMALSKLRPSPPTSPVSQTFPEHAIAGSKFVLFEFDRLNPSRQVDYIWIMFSLLTEILSFLAEDMTRIRVKTRSRRLVQFYVHTALVKHHSPWLSKLCWSCDFEIKKCDDDNNDDVDEEDEEVEAENDDSGKSNGSHDDGERSGESNEGEEEEVEHEDDNQKVSAGLNDDEDGSTGTNEIPAPAVVSYMGIMLNSFLAEEFSIIVDWMYGANISWTKLESSHPAGCPLMAMASLYLTADGFEIRRLQNQLMDAIRMWTARTARKVNPMVLRKVLEPNINKTPLHTLLLQSHVYMLMNNSARKAGWERKSGLLSDKIMALFGREVVRYQCQPYQNPALLEGCHFHLHDDGIECDLLED